MLIYGGSSVFDSIMEVFMKTLEIMAEVENLPEVTAFVCEQLENADCPMKVKMQIELALEEIFVNIANYAYAPEKGKAVIGIDITDNRQVVLTFEDSGTPYDPLAKQDPDVTLSADKREIGGLGIFMVKKTMDDMYYEYRDKKNVLTLKKSM